MNKMYLEKKILEVLKSERKAIRIFFNPSNMPPQYTIPKIVSQSKVRKAIRKMALNEL